MADLIIRGMEMPATCWNCKLKVGFSACGLVTDHKDGGLFYRVHNGNSRPDWCPLVPLPEGHGKIIDADKLWENMTVEQSEAFQKGLASDIELFEILEAAEAIVPEEYENG